MSSKFKVLSFAIAAILAFGAFTAHADVTGSFTTSINVLPDSNQTVDSEIGLLEFDVENAINLTVVISGLSTTLHSHFGLAGVEDVTLSYAATLGALDINGQFVFGRFAASAVGIGANGISIMSLWNPYPQQNEMRFIKKRVEMGISLGGVTFNNLAMFEDVTLNGPVVEDAFGAGADLVYGGLPSTVVNSGGFPLTAEWPQTPVYGFGDVISLSGQTPSGVSISASTGICAEQHPNVIKKHTWKYRVNPHCAGIEFEAVDGQYRLVDDGFVKPDLMFDFENLTISGVPVASGVTASAVINCVKTTACSMTNTFNFSGAGPIPFSASFLFSDLFTLTFAGAELTFTTGPGTLVIGLTDTGELEVVDLDLSTTLNPDTNPATFFVDATFDPGQGLESADVGLNISRSNVDFGIEATFEQPSGAAAGDPAEFDSVSFSVGTAFGAIDMSTSASFGAFGFTSSTTSFTINF